MDLREGFEELEAIADLMVAQTRLADRLEAIADALPRSSPEECRVLARELPSTLALLHSVEERCLLTPLAGRLPQGSPFKATLERMRCEHLEDVDAATELADALLRFSEAKGGVGSDTLAYQLRSLFVALRRHHALDLEVLLPEARARFTPADRARLEAALRLEACGRGPSGRTAFTG